MNQCEIGMNQYEIAINQCEIGMNQCAIGTEANNLVNCTPERGHNWIIKHSILLYLYQMHNYYVNSLGITSA